MAYVISLNKKYLYINQSKYKTTVKIHSSIDLAKVYNSVKEAMLDYVSNIDVIKDSIIDYFKDESILELNIVTVNIIDTGLSFKCDNMLDL